MTDELRGRRVAVLATDGVEQVESTQPRKAVEKAGAQVVAGLDRRPARSRP